jgi:hypothetical protein
MHERPGRVIARAVVERAGHDIDFLGPGVVNVELQELGTGINLENLRLRAVGALP